MGPAFRDLQALVDHQVEQERQDPLGFQGHQDHQDRGDPQDLLVLLDHLVHEVQLVLAADQDNLVLMVLQEPLVLLVMLEHLVRQVGMDHSEDLLVPRDQEENLEPLQALVAFLVPLAKLVQKVEQEPPVAQDLSAELAQQDSQVSEVSLVLLENQDQEVY